MATTKKKEVAPAKKRYIVLKRLSNRDGTEAWLRGSARELTDAEALPLLQKGSIMPADETTPPSPPPPPIIIHPAPETPLIGG